MLLDQICELRATTLAGIRARGQMFAIYDPEQAMPHGPYPDAMLWALIRDLSQPVEPSAAVIDPDAAIHAIRQECQEIAGRMNKPYPPGECRLPELMSGVDLKGDRTGTFKIVGGLLDGDHYQG